jgi:D-lactate dehydrogenase
MPAAARPLPRTSAAGASAIYFASCITRTMGTLPGEPSGPPAAEALVRVASRAGLPLHIPPDVAGLCCGVPFSSKGYAEAHALVINRTVEKMWSWSNEGALPIVVDTSPCTYGLRLGEGLTPENRGRLDRMRILDATEYVADVLLPRLTLHRRSGAVALHPVCSLVKMNLAGSLEAIGRACAEKAFVAPSAGCCGFAGDRGWLVPELTASATKDEAAEIRAGGAVELYASSRTCEIGLSRATGMTARSFVHLVERATRTPD